MDLAIFEPLLKKRPEISVEKLKQDLEEYYLPYLDKLIEFKQKKEPNHALIVGISAIQGAGKTTQGEILEVLLDDRNLSSVSLSIDDHYITHGELSELRRLDPRFIRRGVTHDINLAIDDLKNLETMTDGNPIIVSGYFKGAFDGDGGRFRWINPVAGVKMQLAIDESDGIILQSASYRDTDLKLPENMGENLQIVEHLLPDQLCQFLNSHKTKKVTVVGAEKSARFIGDSELEVLLEDLPKGWRVVDQKPDFIFYDGWMLGAKTIDDESVFDVDLPALETAEDKLFAKFINQKLVDYEKLWQMIDFMTVLYVPNYQISLQWRDQAEEALRQKGEGMSSEEIKQFVYYFWRSVHPAIHIKDLAFDKNRTQQLVFINDDHGVEKVIKNV